jgi:hypothetical protein
MQPVRLRIILPPILGGVLVIGGGSAAYLHFRTPARAFRDQWDANIAATAPAVYPAMQADPVLRQFLLDKSEAAFERGGWHAANKVFYDIVGARITAFAGDRATLECAKGWRNVYQALQATPKLCRQMDELGPKSLPHGTAANALKQEEAACEAAIEDGGQQRLLPNPPSHMIPDEQTATYNRTLDAPAPLTPAERAALDDSAPADDAAYCSAIVKHDDNIASMPLPTAARYLRALYASQDDGKFEYTPPGAPLYVGDPPADFTCAAAGTRFILSMESTADGKPVTWESLGRKGWDCQIRSSLTGVHGLWTSDSRDEYNALRLLWPLKNGKTAGAFRITGYGSKAFFSEEKKQKTFANSGVCAACKVRDSIRKKSFGSFLQKRTPSLLKCPLQIGCPLAFLCNASSRCAA